MTRWTRLRKPKLSGLGESWRPGRARHELIPVIPDSESGEPISWYGLGWQQASMAGAVSDEGLFPRRLGRFEILRELGRGGLGVVFLAQDELLNRLVAPKVPRPEVLVTPQVASGSIVKRRPCPLAHPNLVPVHEVGQVGPIIYIVSAGPYCPGPSLAEWLREGTDRCHQIWRHRSRPWLTLCTMHTAKAYCTVISSRATCF